MSEDVQLPPNREVRFRASRPAYDYAEITGIAASHVVYELLSAMGKTTVATIDRSEGVRA